MKQTFCRHGFTLLEVLIVIALLGITAPICGKLLLSSTRLGAAQAIMLDRMQAVSEVGGRFRDLARAGLRRLDSYGRHASGPRTAVFEARGEDGAPRIVVLGPLRDASHLSCLVIDPNGPEPRADKWLTYRLPLEDWNFSWSKQARLLTLDLRIKHDAGERQQKYMTHRFSAALRNTPAGTTPAVEKGAAS